MSSQPWFYSSSIIILMLVSFVFELFASLVAKVMMILKLDGKVCEACTGTCTLITNGYLTRFSEAWFQILLSPSVARFLICTKCNEVSFKCHAISFWSRIPENRLCQFQEQTFSVVIQTFWFSDSGRWGWERSDQVCWTMRLWRLRRRSDPNPDPQVIFKILPSYDSYTKKFMQCA